MDQQQQPWHLNPILLVASTALLLSLAIAGGLGYHYWQTENSLNQINTQLRDQIKKTETNLNNTATLQSKLQQQQTSFTELQQIKAGRQRPWVLAEANYLVQLANYNLVFSRDIPTAIVLLQTADQRIASLNDATLATIRQSLAKYISALQATSPLDLAGLLARLNALQEQASQLPIRTAMPAPEKPIATPVKSEDLPAWHRALRISWETLQKLIIIRHHEQPVVPLLPQEQQAYLQQNLQLLLQEAQWAALHGQVDVYQISLQQAKNALQRYFAADAVPTQTAIQTITALQKINMRPTLPAISVLAQTIQKAASTATHTPAQGE